VGVALVHDKVNQDADQEGRLGKLGILGHLLTIHASLQVDIGDRDSRRDACCHDWIAEGVVINHLINVFIKKIESGRIE